MARRKRNRAAREAPRARPRRALDAAVLVLAVAVYANTVGNGFTLDDDGLVTDNPLIRSLANVPEMLRSDYWYPVEESDLYRPLVVASYALNHAAGGLSPAGYHALNVALHAAVSLLVLALFRRLTPDAGIAAGGALLFAAHAVHSEAVANVAGRAEILCALFYLTALWAHVGARRGGSRGLAVLAPAAYALALLCKENAVTLLGVLILYDLVFRDREASFAKRIPGYLAYVAVTVAYLAARSAAVGGSALAIEISDLDNPLASLDVPTRVLNALHVGLRALGLLAFPRRLAYDYSLDAIPLLRSWGEPRALLVLAAVAALAVLLVWSARREKLLFFALAFAGASWSVVSNVFVPIGTIFGERLLYLPSVGFCLALAWALRRAADALPASRGARRAAFGIALAVLVLGHGVRAAVRNADWESDAKLMLADLAVQPRSAKVQMNAGVIYLYELDRPREALEAFDAALRIKPDATGAHLHRAHALVLLGRKPEALPIYDAILRQAGDDPGLWNALGYVLVDGDVDPARGVALLEKAVRLQPENPEFLDSLGWAYFKTGRPREGRALIARSLAIDDSGASGRTRRDHLAEIDAVLAKSRP